MNTSRNVGQRVTLVQSFNESQVLQFLFIVILIILTIFLFTKIQSHVFVYLPLHSAVSGPNMNVSFSLS